MIAALNATMDTPVRSVEGLGDSYTITPAWIARNWQLGSDITALLKHKGDTQKLVEMPASTQSQIASSSQPWLGKRQDSCDENHYNGDHIASLFLFHSLGWLQSWNQHAVLRSRAIRNKARRSIMCLATIGLTVLGIAALEIGFICLVWWHDIKSINKRASDPYWHRELHDDPN